MLLDRLMVALHHALEDDDKTEVQRLSEIYRNGQLPIPPTNKQNVLPKYYKGKTDSDAYYGYKLINGQTGEFAITNLVVDYWCCYHKIYYKKKYNKIFKMKFTRTFFHHTRDTEKNFEVNKNLWIL